MDAALPLAPLLNQVRAFDRFPSVDTALAAIRNEAETAPGFGVQRLGSTRGGEPLDLISFGTGPRTVLVAAGPHPNEPVGLLTTMELVRLVAGALRAGDAEAAAFTWHVLPCWDLDGARLNEGWYTAPCAIETYHRNFYRPALAHQPEWTFPFDHPGGGFRRPLPETRALMDAIDVLRPELLCSLHNSDVGGAFFILDDHDEPLAARLASLPGRFGLPVDAVSVDTLGWASPAHGVHVLPAAHALHGLADPAEHPDGAADTAPAEPGHGSCSLHYAQKHATRGLMAEVPQWRVRRPPAPGADTWDRCLRDQAARLERALAPLHDALAAAEAAAPDSPYLPAVRDTLHQTRAAAARWQAGMPVPGDPALAEAVWNAVYDGAQLFPLRALGMWQRMFPDDTAGAATEDPALRAATRHAHRTLGPLCRDFTAETGATPFPLRDLVTAQLSAIFTAASTPRRTDNSVSDVLTRP